jgi:hypothetical protein
LSAEKKKRARPLVTATALISGEIRIRSNEEKGGGAATVSRTCGSSLCWYRTVPVSEIEDARSVTDRSSTVNIPKLPGTVA